MRRTRFVCLLLAWLLIGPGNASPARAAVVYLNHFNSTLDADQSSADPKASPDGGATLTSGGQGYPFADEKAGEALDLGLADPAAKAAVSYEVPVQDLRSGTVEFFIKTGFDWNMKRDRSPEAKDPGASHAFLCIPMKGGMIDFMWYNSAAPTFAFHIYEGTRDHIVAFNADATADRAVSAETAKMGLTPGRDVYVFQFCPRDPDKFPRRGGPLPENWDRMFTKRTCEVIPAGEVKARMSFDVPALEPELTRMLAVTQVPAVFCSQEGQETNLLLPTMLGGSIEGPFDLSENGYRLKVSTPLYADILVYVPRGDCSLLVNRERQEGKLEKVGDEVFRRVSVPQGDSTVEVRRERFGGKRDGD